MKGQAIAGAVVAVLAVVVLLLGILNVVRTEFVASNVPVIVGSGFSYVLYGIVAFIVAVVVYGSRSWMALVLHVAAIVPYYFATQSVITVGNTQATDVGSYWSASAIPWIVGIVLNIAGIAVNRLKPKKKPEEVVKPSVEAAPGAAAPPPAAP